MILLLPIIIITIIIEYNPIIILESNRIAYELSCLFREKKTPRHNPFRPCFITHDIKKVLSKLL